MRFGVIYSIDWSKEDDEECPFERIDDKELLALFEKQGSKASEYETFGDEGLHAQFISKDLLTREQFERFLSVTQLRADSTPTRGSIIGYGTWGLDAFSVPAIMFDDPGNDMYMEQAYVTPFPDVAPRLFLDQEEAEVYMAWCWERVSEAVINTYEDGV